MSNSASIGTTIGCVGAAVISAALNHSFWWDCSTSFVAGFTFFTQHLCAPKRLSPP